MICKKECISFLEKQRAKERLIVTAPNSETDAEVFKSIIKRSATGEEAYIKLAEILTVADTSFSSIGFREDCYDFLIEQGFNTEDAYALMEIVRKGQYRFERFQVKSDELSEAFFEWAKTVKYLPSRKTIYEIYSD